MGRPRIAGKNGDQYIEAMSKVCDRMRRDAFVAAREVGFDSLCEIVDGRPRSIDTVIQYVQEVGGFVLGVCGVRFWGGREEEGSLFGRGGRRVRFFWRVGEEGGKLFVLGGGGSFFFGRGEERNLFPHQFRHFPQTNM